MRGFLRWLPLAAVLLIAWCCANNDEPTTAVLANTPFVALPTKELLEKRGNLLNQAKGILEKADAENRDLTPEEDAQFAAIHKDCSEIKAIADGRHQADERRRQQSDAEAETAEMLNIGVSPEQILGSAAPQHPRGRATDEDRALAIQAWFMNQSSRSDITLSPEHIQAAQKAGVRLNAQQLVVDISCDNYSRLRREVLSNSLSTSGGSSGGYLRPDSFRNSLE